MTTYVMRRLINAVPTMLLLIFVVVALVRAIPGNAVDVALAEQGTVTPQARHQFEKALGLDTSIVPSYIHYTGKLLTGDLGSSLWSHDSVAGMIFSGLLPTVEISVAALIIGFLLGIALGTVAAARRGSLTDHSVRAIAIVFLSLPAFALATALVVLPVIWFGWSVPIVYHTWMADPVGHIEQMAAPVLVLALGFSGMVMRYMRTSALDVIGSDYIRTARSKGIGPTTIMRRHMLRNALIPMITLAGLAMPTILSGSVVIESIFGVPGLGLLLQSALGNRDYPVIQGMTVVTGVFVILINIAVDAIYTWVDPRVTVA